MKSKRLAQIISMLLLLVLLMGTMVSCVQGEQGVQGEKGADGITPSFKVEENVLYVSYDDGVTWSNLGNIGGKDGKDGENGVNGTNGTNGTNGKDGVSITGVETDAQGRLVFILSNGNKLPPVEIPRVEADSEHAALIQAAREAFVQHLIQNAGIAENTQYMVYSAEDKFVALHNGSVVGVYESGAAALKALFDDVKTTDDESEIYMLTNTATMGLFTVTTKQNVVDLIMFMGQSNMAGRGTAADAPAVGEGYGYEFRAVSDPTKLYPITEPFGVSENRGVVTEKSKTGSMVSAFVNAYYEERNVPVVAVSCSKGGTATDFWAPNGDALNEAIARHDAAKEWLEDNGYTIARDFMVWCQGESDANDGVTASAYASNLKAIIEEMATEAGTEFCAVVRIGNHRDLPNQYDKIMLAQTHLCKAYDKAVLVSTKLAAFAEEGKMKDEHHYIQEAYNIVGADAGANTAYYINEGKEPSMYDPEYDNTYPSDDIPPMDTSYSSLEFTFNATTENAIDFSGIGTVQNGILSVDSTKNQTANGIPLLSTISISPDKSFTIEFVINAKLDDETTGGGIILGSGSTKGGFLYCANGKVRLRFGSSANQYEATDIDLSDTTHIAVVYDATTGTLSIYQDGVNKEVTKKGSFGTINFNTLCGGYNNENTYYFQGEMHYFKYVNQALSVTEFHQE